MWRVTDTSGAPLCGSELARESSNSLCGSELARKSSNSRASSLLRLQGRHASKLMWHRTRPIFGVNSTPLSLQPLNSRLPVAAFNLGTTRSPSRCSPGSTRAASRRLSQRSPTGKPALHRHERGRCELRHTDRPAAGRARFSATEPRRQKKVRLVLIVCLKQNGH